MKRLLALSLAIIPLAGCDIFTQTPPIEEEEQTSSIPETKNVIYRGLLLPLGASIYMEGSHRLELEDGRFVLLESDGLLLDEYLNMEVEVFGATRPTVEGGAIIMRVERIAQWIESSAAASSESSVVSSVAAAMPSSSAAPAAVASVPAAVSRPAVLPPPVASSSKAPAPVASSVAPVTESSASSSGNAALDARTATMAKAKMDPANWTQQYCSTHIGFCFPVHKNWYYVSFGATSSSLWHVELSSEELVSLGDGPISVVLVSGNAPGPDGQVTVENGVATGIRTWTDGRHVVISAPASLEAAVRYITQELKSAPLPASSASGAGA